MNDQKVVVESFQGTTPDVYLYAFYKSGLDSIDLEMIDLDVNPELYLKTCEHTEDFVTDSDIDQFKIPFLYKRKL
jgi:hypothetical protein